MKEKKKVHKELQLKVVKETSKYIFFMIEKQSRRGQGFTRNKRWEGFRGTNGIKLVSVDEPEWDSLEKTLFVRGERKLRDKKVLMVSKKTFSMIMDTVREYNVEYNVTEKTKVILLPDLFTL